MIDTGVTKVIDDYAEGVKSILREMEEGYPDLNDVIDSHQGPERIVLNLILDHYCQMMHSAKCIGLLAEILNHYPKEGEE